MQQERRRRAIIIASAILLVGVVATASLQITGQGGGDKPSGLSSGAMTDDTAMVKRAIDEAQESGRPVRLDERRYWVRRGLTIPAGVTLDGNGATIVSSARGRAAIWLESRTQMRDIQVISDGRVQTLVTVRQDSRDVSITSCNLQGSGDTFSGLATQERVSDLSVRDSAVSDAMHGIRLDGGPKRVHVANVRIQRWKTRGIYIPGTRDYAAQHINLTGLIVEQNVGAGNSRYPIVALSKGRRHHDIKVQDSIVRGRGTEYENRTNPGTADQISISMTNGVVIRGNISTDSGERGVNVTRSKDVAVVGNTVARSDSVGIGIGAIRTGARGVRDVQIRDNVVIDSGRSRAGTTPRESQTGIRLYRVHDGAVTNNTVIVEDVDRRDTYGLTVDAKSSVSISMNSFVGVFAEEILRTG